ncbi:RabGAP/TBC domain-containing protein [Heterostelium album PN500]|uniref:RabGAP/TBC domain-containing protein n=1 Tax=Heterostelium pallidum (strain ATCC 26659 / Pp 5 / PN500) TaxID=670386 RepID=D3AXP5_HETP5|nr:RabGAP/TBC domain-containing protein [Heterostelium album PN500]EFA85722.1 RabGAP/TBC domain-containing protein [Heterostelium album PN500]|eukprot:XP_020437828.1 RabGAP/TBC domain-containing protein [Heterostelium album PN500]
MSNLSISTQPYEFKIIYSKQDVTIYPTDGDSKGIEGVISLYYSYDTGAVLSPSKQQQQQQPHHQQDDLAASSSSSFSNSSTTSSTLSSTMLKSVMFSWIASKSSFDDDDTTVSNNSSSNSNPLARSQPISIKKSSAISLNSSALISNTNSNDIAQQYQQIKLSSKEIHSIKKYTPTIGTPYIIVLTRNGTALPPFFFENGGVREFIKALRSVNPNLKKSTLDTNLYMMMSDTSDLAEIQTSTSIKKDSFLSSLSPKSHINSNNSSSLLVGASFQSMTINDSSSNSNSNNNQSNGNGNNSSNSTTTSMGGLGSGSFLNLRSHSPSSMASSTISLSPNTLKTPLSTSHGSPLDTEASVPFSSSPNSATPTSLLENGSSSTSKRRLTKEISSNILDSFAKVSNFAKNAQKNIFEEPAKKIDNHFRNLTHSLGSKKTSPQHSNNTSLNSSLNSSSDFFTPFNLNASGILDEPAINRTECNPLNANEWYSYFDEEGRISIMNQQLLQKKIFYGGVHESIRAEVWPFLLNFYPFDSTHSTREVIKYEKTREYFTIKKQWQSISADQELRFSKYASRKALIEKDVIRTDRLHPMYLGIGMDNPNLVIVKEILLTYSFYNFDIGYVQGMSDLLTPIYSVIQKEVESFWCFVGLMDRVELNFHKDQNGMHTQLNTLSKLLKYMDYDLYSHFEFPFEQVKTLWEVFWCNYMTKSLPIFMCLSVLLKDRSTIIEENMQFDQILKMVNSKAGKMDVDDILSFTESVINYFVAKVSVSTDQIDQSIRSLFESIYQY